MEIPGCTKCGSRSVAAKVRAKGLCLQLWIHSKTSGHPAHTTKIETAGVKFVRASALYCADCGWHRKFLMVREDGTLGVTARTPPLGFRRTEEGALERDPNEWKTVQLILKLQRSGMTQGKIVEELNQRKLRSRVGTPFILAQVQRVCAQAKIYIEEDESERAA